MTDHSDNLVDKHTELTQNVAEETTDTPTAPVKAPTSDAQPDSNATNVDATDTPEDETADDGSKASREAKRYRLELRATQGELETSKAAVTTAQTALVDHLAQTLGRVKPAALWASGVTLDDLTDDNGNVSPEKVETAANDAARELGLTRRPKPDPNQGRTVNAPQADAFTQAFTPRN